MGETHGEIDYSDEDTGFGDLEEPAPTELKRKDLRQLAATQGSVQASMSSFGSATQPNPLATLYASSGSRTGGGRGGATPLWQSRGMATQQARFTSTRASPPPPPAPMGGAREKMKTGGVGTPSDASVEPPAIPTTDSEKVHALIELQDFEGFWSWDSKLSAILGLEADVIRDELAFVTALVIYFFGAEDGCGERFVGIGC